MEVELADLVLGTHLGVPVGQNREGDLLTHIRDALRHPEVPRLSDGQVEAIALLEEIANDASIHVEMDVQPGDVQLLNNARILHAREACEDELRAGLGPAR